MSATKEPTGTSEYRYGIIRQPDNGCPLIDDVLDCLENAMDAIKRYERCDDVDELRDMISTVETELGSVIGYRRGGKMEVIRERMSEIREWGQEWKNLAKQYAPEEERE